MALNGDLETLDFADLFQSLEQHERSGTLTLCDNARSTRLYFEDGKLAMLASDDRRPLLEVLVDAGRISARALERARGKRRGTRRSLGELLVDARAIGAGELHAFALARLFGDACELVTRTRGEFEFVEGPAPRGVFDPEERRLALAVPARQLLLEAARRSDQFGALKAGLGSEDSFYLVEREVLLDGLVDDTALAADLLARLDGTRRLCEVLDAYPERRFEALSMLAFLSERRIVRRARAQDLQRRAGDLAHSDPGRARRMVDHALEQFPRHAGLLELGAELAQHAGETSEAVERRKELAHLLRESGEDEDARAARSCLERARELAPHDATLLEALLELARRAGDSERLVCDGLALAEILAEQGLSKKQVRLLEELASADPQSFEIERRLAHARVAAGDRRGAAAGLLRRGREGVAKERYPAARQAFAELLELDPKHDEARRSLEAIDQGLFAERRRRRRRFALRATIAAAALACGAFLLREARARVALSHALSELADERLVERGEIERARSRLEQVGRAHPWTTTTFYDLPRRREDLERLATGLGVGSALDPPARMPAAEGPREGSERHEHHGGRSAE